MDPSKSAKSYLCGCYQENMDSIEFHKIAESMDAGLIIYRYIPQAPKAMQIKDTDEHVFVIVNTKNTDLTQEDLKMAFGQNTMTCPRCLKIVEHAKRLVEDVLTNDKREIVGVCDHCRLREQQRNPCCRCKTVVEKFISNTAEERERQRQRIKTWLTQVRDLIKNVAIDERKEGESKFLVRSQLNIDKVDRQDKLEGRYKNRLGRGSRPEHRRPRSAISEYYSGKIFDSEIFYKPGHATDSSTFSNQEEYGHVEKPVVSTERYKALDTDSALSEQVQYKLTRPDSTFQQRGSTSHKDNQRKDQILKGEITGPPEVSSAFLKHFEDNNFEKKSKKPGILKPQMDNRVRTEHYVTKAGLLPQKVLVPEGKKQRSLASPPPWTHHSRENILKALSEPDFSKVFSFYFPGESKVQETLKEYASSSELIKETQDMHKAKAGEETKEKEELKIREGEEREKHDQAEKKRPVAERKKMMEIERQGIYESINQKTDEEEKIGLLEKKTHKKSDEGYMIPASTVVSTRKRKDTDHITLAEEPKSNKKTDKPNLKSEKSAKGLQKETDKSKSDRVNKSNKETEKPNLKSEKSAQGPPKQPDENESKSKKPKVDNALKSEKTENPTEKLTEQKSRKMPKKQAEKEKEEELGKVKQASLKEIEKNVNNKEEKQKVKGPKAEGKEEKPKKELPMETETKKIADTPEDKKKTNNEKNKSGAADAAFKQMLAQKEKEKAEQLKFQKEQEKETELAKKRAKESEKLTKVMEGKNAKEEAAARLKQMKEAEQPDPEQTKISPTKKGESPTMKDLAPKEIKVKSADPDDLILRLVKLKKSEYKGRERINLSKTKSGTNLTRKHVGHSIKNANCPLCNSSDLMLDLDEYMAAETHKPESVSDIIIGDKIFKHKISHKKSTEIKPISDFKESDEERDLNVIQTEQKTKLLPIGLMKPAKIKTGVVDAEAAKGVIRYALSDRTFIEKGWTMLPTEKVVRKMNVYRMRPAHPEFDWFEHNKYRRVIEYDSGEKFAEFDDNGRGKWFYRSGKLALDYYDAEETNAGQRFVVYSSGEPDERGRARPRTILATFDYLGNGIVFDHTGKIRLKYNQTEGVVLDRGIGPVSHWKWHTLNDPPVLQQVMIDTQMPYKDPNILKLGGSGTEKTRIDNEEMLAIEFDNFIKEKSKKLTQKFKPFQIKMKALKINEYFSLRVLDQATVYLLYRDGTTNLKINIGMILDHKEIVDTDTAEVGEVSNSLERLPARTDSLAGLQLAVAQAQRAERARVRHERRLKAAEPCVSADQLRAGISRPLRPPLLTVSASEIASSKPCPCRLRKPPSCNLYYNTQL